MTFWNDECRLIRLRRIELWKSLRSIIFLFIKLIEYLNSDLGFQFFVCSKKAGFYTIENDFAK
jgi:hypothetical protein